MAGTAGQDIADLENRCIQLIVDGMKPMYAMRKVGLGYDATSKESRSIRRRDT